MITKKRAAALAAALFVTAFLVVNWWSLWTWLAITTGVYGEPETVSHGLARYTRRNKQIHWVPGPSSISLQQVCPNCQMNRHEYCARHNWGRKGVIYIPCTCKVGEHSQL